MSKDITKRTARICSPDEVAAHRAHLAVARTMRAQIKKAVNNGYEKGIAVKSRVMKELDPEIQRFAQMVEDITKAK